MALSNEDPEQSYRVMLSAENLLAAIERLGITHVVGIPDNATAPLYSLLQRHTTIRNLTVTREGEAFAVAAGLWIGGAAPCVSIQNTGLLESGDSLRGTLIRMRIGIPCLISCRGYSRLSQRRRSLLAESDPDWQDLSRPELDSVALLTEPTLRSWGVPCWSLQDPGDLSCVAEANQWAQQNQHPVALLLEAGVSAGGGP